MRAGGRVHRGKDAPETGRGPWTPVPEGCGGALDIAAREGRTYLMGGGHADLYAAAHRTGKRRSAPGLDGENGPFRGRGEYAAEKTPLKRKEDRERLCSGDVTAGSIGCCKGSGMHSAGGGAAGVLVRRGASDRQKAQRAVPGRGERAFYRPGEGTPRKKGYRNGKRAMNARDRGMRPGDATVGGTRAGLRNRGAGKLLSRSLKKHSAGARKDRSFRGVGARPHPARRRDEMPSWQ